MNITHTGQLPVTSRLDPGQLVANSASLRPAADDGKAVLVADDDPTRRASLSRVLSDAGFTVHQAATGAEAVRQATRWRPGVVIVDLALRDPAGDRVLQEIRTNPVTNGLAVLVLTRRDHPDEAAAALKGGADDFVAKPLDLDELRVRVEALANHRAPSRAAPAPSFRIDLFGPLRVYVGERVAIDEHFARRKAKALLAYLWLQRGRYLSREQLVEAIWPEADPSLGRGRLKQTILVLRSAIEPPRQRGANWRYIVGQGGSYSFNPSADVSSDVEEFERELRLAREARESGNVDAALDHYRRAFELHRSEFLPEFRSEDWAESEATRLDDLYLQALEEASSVYAAGGRYAPAVELLCQVVRADPFRERTYEDLMRFLWQEGKHADALRVYQRLRDVLASALEVAPDAEATRLAEAIRRDRAIAEGPHPPGAPRPG